MHELKTAIIASLVLLCGLFAFAAPTSAQQFAVVVSACGTPPLTYNAGQSYPLTMDTTGKLCAGGGGGGATSVSNSDGTLTISPTTGAVVASIANPVILAVTDTPTQAANTSVDGFVLADPTAASTGNQQFSPRLRLTGQGWKTTSTAASQATDWIIENQPVQGTAAPTSNLVFSSQINATGYTQVASLSETAALSQLIIGNATQTGELTLTTPTSSSSFIAFDDGVPSIYFFASGSGRWGYDSNNLNFVLANVSVNSAFGFASTGINASGFNCDTCLTRKAAANWQIGRADSAAPVAYTVSAQSVVAGTSNTAAANWTFIGSLSTGSGASGDLIYQTGGTGAGSTAQNSAVTAMTIKGATQVIQLNAIAADTAHTDRSVCEDTTTHGLYSGTGTAGICLGTSSARYKHGVTDLTAGLADIMALKPKRYFLNADHGDPTQPYYGFLAEDGDHVLPELVGLDTAGRPNTFDYLGIVPVLVKAIQQQQAEINHLKARIH